MDNTYRVDSPSGFYKKIKTSQLDGLELLKVTSYNEDFPMHSHETFCVSLIENGTFKENEQFASKGTIFITNPNEIHRNEVVFETGYSFKTFYISPDVFKKLNKNEPVYFDKKVIENPELFQNLNFIAELILQDPLSINRGNDLISALKMLNMHTLPIENQPFFPKELNEVEIIKAYIAHNFADKISLEDMASMVDLDKFKFIRWFKKHIGFSPFSYITMRRIEKSKFFLQQGATLTDAALDAGFYDQSHFTNYFKHYVGVTPKVYQKGFCF